MKALHEKVNIVPLIAKADCLVPSEIRKLKERVSLCCSGAWPRTWAESTRCAYLASPASDSPTLLQIREEIDKFGIHVYQFPECDSDEDEDFKQQDRELKVNVQPSGWRGSWGPVHMGPRQGPRAQVRPGRGRGV